MGIDQKVRPNVEQLKFLMEAGRYFASRSRFVEACDIFQGVTILAPERSIGWTLLGDALMNWEKFDEAMKAHEKALEIDPESTFARVYYAQTLLFKRQKEKAVVELRKVLEKDPDGSDGVLAKYLMKAVEQGVFSKAK